MIKGIKLMFVACSVYYNCTAQNIYICDTESVNVMLVRAQSLKRNFPDNVFKKYYDFKTHSLLWSRESDKDSFLRDVKFYFEKSVDKKRIISTINDWCTDDKYLDSLGDIAVEVPVEAILYYTKETNKLVAKFNVNKGSQDWSSLSSYELYELNIDFHNYVALLPASKKKVLFAKFKKTLQRVIQDNKYNRISQVL